MDTRKALKSYRFKRIFLPILFIIILFVIVHFFNVAPFMGSIELGLFLLYEIVSVIVLSAHRKHLFLPHLYRDLNAASFQELVDADTKAVLPDRYRLNAALYTGNYQKVVNQCAAIMKDCSKQTKLECLTLLARAYFELGDLEKCEAACREVERLAEGQYQKAYMLQFYRSFRENRFEDCLALCDRYDAFLNQTKKASCKLHQTENSYNRALVYYLMGEFEKAGALFQSIKEQAPQLHLSTLSQQYLEKIEANETDLIADTSVVAAEEYDMFEGKGKSVYQKRAIIKIVKVVLFAVLLLAVWGEILLRV